jgi:hypothetical protein
MLKIKVSLLLGITIFIFSAASANAVVCNLCTLAVGVGVGFSRWLGIDDSVTGLWVGALIVAMISGTIKWLDKKSFNLKGRNILVIALIYVLVIAPLYWTGIMGSPYNSFWGIDKLLIGIIIGSLAFYAVNVWYFKLKEKNGGKAHFPFQRVAMPVSSLAIASLVFYILTK